MIPLRDTIQSRSTPIMTVSLIIANAAAFIFQLSLGQNLNDFITVYGFVPSKFFHLISKGNILAGLFPLFTSIFLHGGWFHIIGNMWYLWIFGDNVEDRVGHFRFVIFYILCGVSAGLIHGFTSPNSGIPTIGASGAIAGVMGAYFVLYPRAKIWTLVPIFFFVQFIEIPAFFFLGFWILMQFFMGTFSLGIGSMQGGVAWWAHIGGFATGALLIFIFQKRQRNLPRQYADQYRPW
ncbi:TPA: rhomboid family intramembrane serine protease [bacterium]|nr:rhomboid family intramembrane serine protease [bacterium]